MPKFGGFNDNDLENLERTAETIEGGSTTAHAIRMPGMRFGGIDDTKAHQVVTRIDHLEGRVVEHIRQNLIPRIAEHSRISIKTDPVKFIYYQELQFGRRCSCWDSVNSAADKRCPICFGQAYVGGYSKRGTNWHVIDGTYPNMTMVNVAPDFDGGKRPVPLSLLPTAIRGYIEMTIQLGPNTGVLDRLQLGAFAPRGSTISSLVRLSTESSFTPMSKTAVESRLVDAFGRPTTLVFRFELSRASPKVKLPLFTFMHFRYRTINDITITADIPQREKSIELQEHGLLDAFDTIEMILDRSLVNVSTGDMMIRVKDGERFKITRSNQWTPEELLIETSVRARHINKDEFLFLVP